MGHDDPQLGEADRDLVHQQRVGVPQRRIAYRRCSLMEQDRQAEALGERVDRERRLAKRVEDLVVGRELDASETELLAAAFDLLEHGGTLGVDGHEADPAARGRRAELRRALVDARRVGRQAGGGERIVDGDVEDDRDVAPAPSQRHGRPTSWSRPLAGPGATCG